MSKIRGFYHKLNMNDKAFGLICLLVLLIGLVPIYRLALYAAPYYDDYSYGNAVRSFYDAYGPSGIISGIIYNVKTFWWAWQGTYGSIIFMSLMPAAFGEEYYFVGLWVIISCITAGTFVFVYNFSRLIGRAGKWLSCGIASISTLFLIELIYSAHQGFYWFNGAVHYTFMHGLMLFMLTCMLRILCNDKKKAVLSGLLWGLLTVLLALLVAGSNFTTALQGALLFALFVFIGIIKKNKRVFYTIPALVAYCFGMYKNCVAPGNLVRGAYYTGQGPIEAILNSLKEAFIEFPTFTGFITLAFLLVLAPGLYEIVRNKNFKFKCPALVVILSFCIYATGFTPSFYAMGGPGVARTWNVIKFTFQLLLIFDEAYILGWVSKKKSVINSEKNVLNKLNHNLAYYFGCCALAILIVAVTQNQAGSYSSYGAYLYTHTGEAQCYRQEHLYRIDAINEGKESGNLDIVLQPHAFKPWLLMGTNELGYSAGDEQNTFMAQFYGVNSIVLDDGTGN